MSVSCLSDVLHAISLFPSSPVGYSWMPLLKDGRMQSLDVQLPVAATLPVGYLCQDTKKVQPHAAATVTSAMSRISYTSHLHLFKTNTTLCCVFPVLWAVPARYQVGGKCQDSLQSEDPCSINNICSGTSSFLVLFFTHTQIVVQCAHRQWVILMLTCLILRTCIYTSSSSTASWWGPHQRATPPNSSNTWRWVSEHWVMWDRCWLFVDNFLTTPPQSLLTVIVCHSLMVLDSSIQTLCETQPVN